MAFKKIVFFVLEILLLPTIIFGCTNNKKETLSSVNIWTSGEDYKNETYINELRKKFPNYEIKLEYLNSSTIASKIKAEGQNTECDIVLSEEYGYLDMIKDNLLELNDFNFDIFINKYVTETKKWTPEVKNGGCIIVNNGVIEKKGLPIPKTYSDLLNPVYKDLIAMPNPKTSGTGYMFLRNLTNAWGDEKALEYFNKLSDNILQFYSSGSGPVNSLIQGEIAIALGMTSQAVEEKNNGADISILFFNEGSPYSLYGNAIVFKDHIKSNVREIFDYLAIDLCINNNNLYFPEKIFVNFDSDNDLYPKDIPTADMSNDTLSEKERLLNLWTLS